MESIIRMLLETRLALTGVAIILLIGAVVQITDAPSSEAINPDTVQCYQIDDSGRIIDNNGRLRGWIRGNEVYNPGMELKYRLSDRNLEDVR